jgi:anti-repressor protein
MTNLEISTQTAIQTMSSREIADLTGKLHKNVLTDCDRLNESYISLSMAKISAVNYKAENGQLYRECLLTKMQTLDLLTGYNIELRIKVNRRWEELERKSLDSITRKDLAKMLYESEEEKERLQAINHSQQLYIEESKPKTLFADSVTASENSILIAELAKIINQNGVDIGQNRLFVWMRTNGYLGIRGDYYNQPTQRAMDLGLFELLKRTINKPDGSPFVPAPTVKVTGKGQIYFVNKLLKTFKPVTV